MTIRRKDFQKAAALLHEFLLKLNVDAECAELRDALNLALLHMQRYYRTLRQRNKALQDASGGGGSANGNPNILSQSLRGLSPMTPFKDAPDKFQWKWIKLEQGRLSGTLPADMDMSITTLPMVIQAARDGNNTMMMQLIERDKDCVEEVDGLGRTALMYAVHGGHLDSIQTLLNQGADVNATAHDGSTAVHRACHDSNDEALQLLIEYRAGLAEADVFGRCPIHWACTTKNRECLRLLIEQGCSVNVRDKEGMSPAMWACRMDHIEHFELLSKVQHQDIDESDGLERDLAGKTWLHWAVRRTEPLECLQTLITEEAADIRDEEGKSVMHTAAEQGSLPACKIILEIGQSETLLHRDRFNRTPLILAAMAGHGEVVNFFLSEGVDLSAVDNYGATAWDYARARQLHYCMLIIASYIRQQAKDDPDTEHSEAQYPGMEDGLGAMSHLQINGGVDGPAAPSQPQAPGPTVNGGGGGEPLVFAGHSPAPPPRAPEAPHTPRTPRTPRNNGHHARSSHMNGDVPSPRGPNTAYAPAPRQSQHQPQQGHFPQGHNGVPRGQQQPPGPAGAPPRAHKRSPEAAHGEWGELDDQGEGEERRESPASREGSGGKRRKNNDQMANEGRMSVMSIDSHDAVSRESSADPRSGRQPVTDPPVAPAPQQRASPSDEEDLNAESHYIEGEQETDSYEHMDVSDFEEAEQNNGQQQNEPDPHSQPHHNDDDNVLQPMESERHLVTPQQQDQSPPPHPPRHPHPRHNSPPHRSRSMDGARSPPGHPLRRPTQQGQGQRKAPFSYAPPVTARKEPQYNEDNRYVSGPPESPRSPSPPTPTPRTGKSPSFPQQPPQQLPPPGPPRSAEGRVVPPAHLQPLPQGIGGSGVVKKKKKKKKRDQQHMHSELAPVAGPVPPPRGYAAPTLPPAASTLPPPSTPPGYPLKSALKKRTPSPAPVEREPSRNRNQQQQGHQGQGHFQQQQNQQHSQQQQQQHSQEEEDDYADDEYDSSPTGHHPQGHHPQGHAEADQQRAMLQGQGQVRFSPGVGGGTGGGGGDAQQHNQQRGHYVQNGPIVKRPPLNRNKNSVTQETNSPLPSNIKQKAPSGLPPAGPNKKLNGRLPPSY